MWGLFRACILTVLIETAFFAACGYRNKSDLSIVAYTNAVTNLVLNMILILCGSFGIRRWILLLECAVVAAEFSIYSRAFGASKKLFLLTLAANVLSFGIGLLLF